MDSKRDKANDNPYESPSYTDNSQPPLGLGWSLVIIAIGILLLFIYLHSIPWILGIDQ
ncbi:MAG: hypothetical protein H6822_21115 [Planctomycetaceae bacterium]|nr:hypothetical protein [Planctomycetales bacterium]MCB9924694.1 hypothetical protein [Planctomycetaceae bacterium]